MQQVDNDTFFKQLAALFKSSEEHGSIWLTHKRLTHDGEDATMKSATGDDDDREYPCLVRVTDGDKAQFSTKVEPGQLDSFHATYGNLLKSSMNSLRKRDKKREKQRQEEAAKRKKRMTDLIPIEGPKRGSGRRKRQRRIKAVKKQESSKAGMEKREEAKIKAKSTS